jgi:hypothetical protein
MAPFYPPSIYQTQAEVRYCDIKPATAQANILSKLSVPILTKKNAQVTDNESTKDGSIS